MKKYLLTIAFLVFNPIFVIGQTNVIFQLSELPDDNFEQVGIRGSIPPLDWQQSIPLEKNENGYEITIEFPQSEKQLEFKFVRYNNDREPDWEEIQNRTLELVSDSNLISKNDWNRDQIIDLSTLKPIAAIDLLEDFELIKTMVLEVHPGTYRYNTKEQIDTALTRLKEKFSHSQTHAAAYLAISELTATIKCDHTKAGFNNQSKIINSVIHFQKDKIPFAFKWTGDQMIVTYNASKNKYLNRGTAILSMNGFAVKDIQKNMQKYIGADGATDANRVYKMEVNGYDFRYNAFDIFFPLLYPIGNDSLNLEIQDYKTEETHNIRVSYLTRDERAEILEATFNDFPTSRDDLWNFEKLENNVGILTINSFGLFGWKAMTIDYKQFLADQFKRIEIEDIKHLIIDIRKNTGGADEMAAELFSYLVKDGHNFEREGRTRYLNFPELLKPHVQSWGDNPWYFNLEPQNNNPVDGYYSFKEIYNLEQNQSDQTIYKGKVYLLTSAANTSLAFYVAKRFKEQNIGFIIGQETGGNLNDINGGQILFLRLPNSQIEIDFPVMGGFALIKQPNMGVKPDIETIYRRDDIFNKKDNEIETVIKMIHK